MDVLSCKLLHLNHIYTSMGAKYLILIKKQLVMDEWICIYNNVVSEHDLKKVNIIFFWFGNEVFCHCFDLSKKKFRL